MPVIFIFQINGSINYLDEILDLAGDCSCKLTIQKCYWENSPAILNTSWMYQIVYNVNVLKIWLKFHNTNTHYFNQKHDQVGNSF